MVREGGDHPAEMRSPATLRPLPDLDPVFSAHDVSVLPVTPNTIRAYDRCPASRVDERITAHYHASAALYKRWSPEGHLYFGYWRWPLNPFRRKALLEELVLRTVAALQPHAGQHLVDLGCGYGTAARLVAKRHGCKVTGITAVEEQMIEGAAAAAAHGLSHLARMRCGDFRRTGFPSGTLDGAYAIESFDYGAGADKEDVLAEAARILKPGGRFAMAGGFLLKPPTGRRAALVRATNEGWAIDCLAQRAPFLAALERVGFQDITVRDISWRLGPSAIHGPLLIARLWLERLLRGTRLRPLERAHLRSCWSGILLGTQFDLFRYLIVSARKA